MLRLIWESLTIQLDPMRCVCSNALTQRIALAIPTRKIRAASFRERPSCRSGCIDTIGIGLTPVSMIKRLAAESA